MQRAASVTLGSFRRSLRQTRTAAFLSRMRFRTARKLGAGRLKHRRHFASDDPRDQRAVVQRERQRHAHVHDACQHAIRGGHGFSGSIAPAVVFRGERGGFGRAEPFQLDPRAAQRFSTARMSSAFQSSSRN